MLARPLLLLVALVALAQKEKDYYRRASLDEQAQLHIVTTRGREFAAPKDTQQVAFAKPAISPDRDAVGWLALYPNAATSYPIPMKLVVFSQGFVTTFTGNGLPVWRWRFERGGQQIALEQRPVHGDSGVHYELRDVAKGWLVTQYDPAPGMTPPAWVQRVAAEP